MFLYLSAAKYNLRFSLFPQLAAAIGLLVLTPVMFGIKALDAVAAAYPLELCLPFIGVILLTPVYSPEQEPGILDTVCARKMPHLLICGIRIIMAMVLTVILICGFVVMMSALECEVFVVHALSSCVNAFFLGGLGILASSVSGHAVSGYILPVLYYVADLTGGFGHFTMFSMMRSGTTDGRYIIFITGICCIAASVWCRHLRMICFHERLFKKIS
ncbi:MAG: hypothetical protein GX213_03450 [Clostridiaceae bacterium]|nr:hypothetical protein [Clostridiaceae bacterium]